MAASLWVVAGGPAGSAVAQGGDASGTYEGTFDLTHLPAPPPADTTGYRAPSLPRDTGPWQGEIELECDGGSCTITSVSASLPLTPLTIAMSGGTATVELRDDGFGGASTGCEFPDPPASSLTLTIDGEQLDMRYEDPPSLLEGTGVAGPCTGHFIGQTITFTGSRVAPAEGPVEEPVGQLPPGTDGGSPSTSDTSGAPVGFIGLAAVAVLGAAAVGVAVVRSRRPKAEGRDAAPAGSASPEVRAAHDPGRQTVVLNGPSTEMGVRARPDSRPRITIQTTVGGPAAQPE